MTRNALPGRRAKCSRCGEVIVFARTLASPSGRGGKAMPLDLAANPEGNVAVRETSPGRLVARVLGKDETHDATVEVRAMPHFATCGSKIGDQVEAWLRNQTAGGGR
jgi:hypothetical protein